MKLMWNKKDGGPESRVHMYGLESKRLGSLLFLRFGRGSREVHHSHAFNCVSRVLTGELYEEQMTGDSENPWACRILLPRRGWFKTTRECMHQVKGLAPSSWVLTIRGPWADTWKEYTKRFGTVTLTHGRQVVR